MSDTFASDQSSEELKTIRSDFQRLVGQSIVKSLVKRVDQLGIADIQQVLAQLDYTQAKGDYTQRGGGNYAQGGGNYNQAMIVGRDILVDPVILNADFVKNLIETKSKGF